MKKRIASVMALCCLSITMYLYANSAQESTETAVQEIVAEMSIPAEPVQKEPIAAKPIWEDSIWAEPAVLELVQEEPSPEAQEPLPPDTENAGQNESEYIDFAIADVSRYVNVRNQPSTDGEIIGKIHDGAVAQVLEVVNEPEEWFRIISGNVEGYIKAEFFIHGDAAAEVMDDYVTHNVAVQADKLNVRAGQSTNDARIGYLVQDEKVKLLEDCGEWLRIQYTEEEDGYVSAEYVIVLEEYTYAKTLEEEAEDAAANKVRQERQQSLQHKTVEIIENFVPPATTYTSNEELRKEIVDYALQYVGNKYVNGGSSLAGGTDCSGFTCFIYADFGYSISRTPSGQYSGAGRSIDYSEIQPGDIICYSSNGGKSCTHVALYIGDGQIVHEANSRKGVITGSVDFEPIIGIKNVID